MKHSPVLVGVDKKHHILPVGGEVMQFRLPFFVDSSCKLPGFKFENKDLLCKAFNQLNLYFSHNKYCY